MKRFYFLILCVLPFCLSSQILNPSFEDWETVNGAENPKAWVVTQDSSQLRYEKSTDAIDGLYSLKIYPAESDAFYYCRNATFQYVYPDMEITDSTNISCFYKVIPVDSSQYVALKIYVYFYDENSQLISSKLNNIENETSEFTYFNVGSVPKETDFIDIYMEAGGVINSDGECLNQSIAWVDKFVISNEIISNAHVTDQSQKPSVFPNPFIHNTRISGLDSDQFTLQIFSIDGSELFDYQLVGKQITFNKKGVFVLKITEDGEFPQFIKIVSL